MNQFCRLRVLTVSGCNLATGVGPKDLVYGKHRRFGQSHAKKASTIEGPQQNKTTKNKNKLRNCCVPEKDSVNQTDNEDSKISP